MLPHPDTAYDRAMLYHQGLQAEAASERLAGQATAGRRSTASTGVRLRALLGIALVRLGERLQGAPAKAPVPAVEPAIAGR